VGIYYTPSIPSVPQSIRIKLYYSLAYPYIVLLYIAKRPGQLPTNPDYVS